jgi:hypothetical protein
VDRIEGNLAVLVSDEGKHTITLSAQDFGLHTNLTVDVTFDGEQIISVKEVAGESERRLAENTNRLHALFSRNKK